MRTATRTKVNPALRDEWLRTFTDLKNQIKMWGNEDPGWSITQHEEREVEEPYLGKYKIEIHRIETKDGQVRLEPIARNYPGRGIVELYAWPTAYRVRLIQEESGGWRVLTDSGIYLHQPWDREHFVRLIQDLVNADDMIAVG